MTNSQEISPFRSIVDSLYIIWVIPDNFIQNLQSLYHVFSICNLYIMGQDVALVILFNSHISMGLRILSTILRWHTGTLPYTQDRVEGMRHQPRGAF